MILYFSATGNSEFIAKEIASHLGDEIINLLNKIKENDFSPIHSDRPFIVVLPVYISALPVFIRKFLKKVDFIGNRHIYSVFTSGGYAGISASQVKHIAKKKHMKWMGAAEITMPRNYIASDMFGQLTDEQINKRIINAYAGLESIINAMQNLEKIKARHIMLWEKLVVPPVIFFWTRYKQSTKPFYVTDKCIGCGKCEKLCPLNCIRIVDKKPLWYENQCAHCMSCIQNCPVGAIEYGKITANKSRYTFSKYKSCLNGIKTI